MRDGELIAEACVNDEVCTTLITFSHHSECLMMQMLEALGALASPNRSTQGSLRAWILSDHCYVMIEGPADSGREASTMTFHTTLRIAVHAQHHCQSWDTKLLFAAKIRTVPQDSAK